MYNKHNARNRTGTLENFPLLFSMYFKSISIKTTIGTLLNEGKLIAD